MKKIDWKDVGEKVSGFAIRVFELALIGSFFLPSRKSNVYVTTNCGSVPASYSGAAKAILESSMLDSYKRDVMEVLKPDGDAEYYKTVISIVNSSMLDSYKRDTIENLSEDF